MKEFINVVGNKACLIVEYWLSARSDWRNWCGFVSKMVREEVEIRLLQSWLLNDINMTRGEDVKTHKATCVCVCVREKACGCVC